MLRGSTKLTACDLSPNMVAIARGKLPETVDVLEANAEVCDRCIQLICNTMKHLPFADGQFSAIFSNLCLQLVNDPDAMLREVHRGDDVIVACSLMFDVHNVQCCSPGAGWACLCGGRGKTR